MAQNAENFAPNKVILDEIPADGVLQVYLKDFPEPILILAADGSILAGDGETPPEAAAGGSGTEIVSLTEGESSENVGRAFVTSSEFTAVATIGASFGDDASTIVVSAAEDDGLITFTVNGVTALTLTPDVPELPASPDAQDIADVLVALGLCTQAA